ncbi:MAG: sensor histidine kinase [Staphylococcus sp.]|nr:sensor histidine kinase [Staphylococcus sp.]
MKILEKKIGLVINLIFCLVFMPLILVLAPVTSWLRYYPEFTYLMIGWLYAAYFIVRFLNLPKLFIEKKYLALTAVISSYIICTYLLTLYPIPEVTFNANALTELYHDIQTRSLTNIVWLTSSLVIGYALSMSFIQELYHQLILKREFEFQKNNAELAVYKAQINPHFLFNTLNSIYSLIIGTSDKAEDAFIKFIDIVKYTYTSVDTEKVPLKEEIKYITNYIDLQSMRLNDHTTVRWSHEVDDDTAMIPPMIMITFLENVFKYGTSSHTDCTIDISLTLNGGILGFHTRNRIMKRAEAVRQSPPVGLTNCRARLNSLFPATHSLDVTEKDDEFIVDLKIQLA